MRKGASRKHHVATSKQNLLAKPYGFCCDIKDDPTLHLPGRVLMPPFLSSGTPNDGPTVKFRVHEDGFPSSTTRGGQKGTQRGGQRGRNTGRRRSGNTNGPASGIANRQRGGNQNRLRGGSASGKYNGQQNERQRGGGNDYYGNISRNLQRFSSAEPSGERMVCQKCRGPLKWYLEDEIAVAREIMINGRIEKYNTEIDRNVQIAKRKEKNRKRPKKKRKQSNEVKENTQENEEKT